MNELTKKLLKLKNKLDDSPYEYKHSYSWQVCCMFTMAANYAPDMDVSEIYDIIHEILNLKACIGL